MPDDRTTGQLLDVTGLSARYPEKTFFLSQVFKHTTNSYKLVWFLALLSLLKRTGEHTLRLMDILAEMVVAAWHPVCFYRLSLGCQDKLQNIVLAIKSLSGLLPDEAPDAIRRFVLKSPENQADLAFLKNYVPTRFLSPWFAGDLRGVNDWHKDGAIRGYIRISQRVKRP